jgi:NitT/TauT family transport system permease protein
MIKNTPRNLTLSAALLVLLLVGWELSVRVLQVPAYIMPLPSQVALALFRGTAGGLYAKHLAVTLGGTLLGFILGCTLAFALGTGVALSKRFDYFLYPYIVMFQAMPKVALAPLIVVWFGLGISSKVVAAALVAFFPLMVNTIVGLRSADEDRVNLMRSLAASEAQIFWKLRLPGALPFIMAGLEVAMILALIGTIVAEFVGAEAGLGMLIQSMNFTMDVAGQFSVLLILAVVGLVLNKGVASVRRRVLFWDASEKASAGVPVPVAETAGLRPAKGEAA